jgi:hypothetical protein
MVVSEGRDRQDVMRKKPRARKAATAARSKPDTGAGAADDKIVLVCASADSSFCARGSSFTHRCRKCNGRVMVAPTGQAFLERHWNVGTSHSNVEIMCADCFSVSTETIDSVGLTAPAHVIVEEFLNSQPNAWRERN